MSENNIVRQRQGGHTEENEENNFSIEDNNDIKKEIPIKKRVKDEIRRTLVGIWQRAFKRAFLENYPSNNILLILTILSFITRFWNINYPTQVVFDEVHFGKFASYYLKRSYFFDVHPPLAKLMLAAMGWLLNFDGHFEFDNIGDDYITNNVPYIGLRGLPATLGALFVPLTYIILIESGYPVVTATFAAGLYSNEWWLWMITTGFFLGLTLSVKMVGFFTVLTIGTAVLIDLWDLLDIHRGLTMAQFKKHFFSRAAGLIIVPISVYLFWFYVHFAILNTSGTGDNFMSPAFQETLHGNLMSTQKRYPLRYDDGRVSSKGQQVTGYPHNDTNNHWRIKTPGSLFDSSRPENDTIKHGDFIILEHVGTQSYLLTHDVASPLMPTNQEFTTIEPNDTARFNDTLFQVFTKDGDKESVIKTKSSFFRLIHFNTKVALWTHESKLPEWAFGQQEVNGNKKNTDKSNYWFEPKKPTRQLSFLRKFFELQNLMISHNAGLTKPHPYSSGPINWPFLIRGISFWTNSDTKEQIYLIGNLVGWWIAIGLMSVLVGVLAADMLSRRRGTDPIPKLVFNFMFVESINYPISIPIPSRSKHTYLLSAKVDVITIAIAALALILDASIFFYLAPITYGTPGLSPEEVYYRRLLDTWDLHFQPKL
nr:12793_t:CDS:10 [Entrophospora candida]